MAFASHRDFSREKKRKLDEQGQEIAKKARTGISEQPLNTSTNASLHPFLFTGFILYFDGYTGSQSRLQLRESVLIRGGKVKDKLEPSVTHIIADRIIDSKLMKLKKPVVRPAWILKCIEGGTLFPIREYRVVLGGMNKSLAMFSKGPASVKVESGVMALIDESGVDNIGGVLSCDEDAPAFVESDHESKAKPNTDADPAKMYSYLQQRIDRKAKVQKTAIEPNPNPSRFPDRQTNPSDSWIKQNSSTAPDFIKRYFQSSRLHHISTQKLMLRDYLAELILARPAQPQIANGQKYIFHVDMDCFFVSVSIRTRPDLYDKPVAVAHTTHTHDHSTSPSKSAQASTSEISSCNYPARSFGVSAGMVVGKAKLLCADLVVLPYDFGLYECASRGLYEVLVEFSSSIQAVSCDEAFLEFECEEDSLYQVAERIRARVVEVTGCNASVGIGSNILLARLATKKAKPNNAYRLDPSSVDAYIGALSVRDLPGIGRKIQDRLESKFLTKTCLDLRRLSKSTLKNEFGDKMGQSLYEYARGVDERKLENKERQSVGAEINWGVRFEHVSEVNVFLEELCGEAVDRLRAAKMQTKSITLKIMKRKTTMEAYKVLGHGDCDSFTRSKLLASPTDAQASIWKEVQRLLTELRIKPADMRGIGIQFTKLTHPKVPNQFAQSLKQNAITANRKVKKAVAVTPATWTQEKPSSIDRAMFDVMPSDIQDEYRHLLVNVGPGPAARERSVSIDLVSDGDVGMVDSFAVHVPIIKRVFDESDFTLNFSQIDPALLAFLPKSTIAELKAQSNSAESRATSATATTPTTRNRPLPILIEASKELQSFDLAPNASQMNMEIFSNLPAHIQREIRYAQVAPPKPRPKIKGRNALPKVKYLDKVVVAGRDSRVAYRGAVEMEGWIKEMSVVFGIETEVEKHTGEIEVFLVRLIEGGWLGDFEKLFGFMLEYVRGMSDELRGVWLGYTIEWLEVFKDAVMAKYGKGSRGLRLAEVAVYEML